MKRVYQRYDDIVRLWYGQHQEEANTPGYRVFFEGKTIYSYGRHFPIASVTEIQGKQFILFTTRGYSNTTAKHKRIVWRMIMEARMYNAPEVLKLPIITGTMEDNIALLEEEITVLRIKRAAARKPELHDPAINQLRKTVARLRELLGLAAPRPEQFVNWNVSTSFEGD